jgi:glycosyltransferase involved in cell wall biosynthesis
MSSQPLVSVVIPCFNSASSVSDAISSALLQTYTAVEVIVVDDGSTDSSPVVIRSFGASVRCAATARRGAGAARNLGLAMASGDLIQFLDADDVLHPDKLSRQVPELLKSGTDLVFSDAEVYWENRPFARYARRFPDDGDPVVFMLSGQMQTAQPLHFKSRLLAVGGFRESLPCAQDRELHLRLAYSGFSFRRLPGVLVTVRRSPGGVSSDIVRVLDQHLAIVREAYVSLRLGGRLTEDRARACAGLLARDARVYLRCGRADRALLYFRAAAEMHPSGGIKVAYSPSTRAIRGLFGPVLTERLVHLKRSLVSLPPVLLDTIRC